KILKKVEFRYKMESGIVSDSALWHGTQMPGTILIILPIFAGKKQDMTIKNNILETIGKTPLIRLNKITSGLPCTVLAKVEYFNPGNSAKDRMAIKMVEVAEQEGKLKPGGTI